MGDLDLPAIRRALAEATPGPWVADKTHDMIVTEREPVPGAGGIVICEGFCRAFVEMVADRDLIVLLRNSAPALLAEIERLRKVEAAAREYLGCRAEGADQCSLREVERIYELRAALDAALGGL